MRLNFDTLRNYAHETYLGGYTSEHDIEIFRHGMETVFNFLESKLRDVSSMEQAMSEPKRLSEKDVAEIRRKHDRTCITCTLAIERCTVCRLLADRDARLAEFKEARELIDDFTSYGYADTFRDEGLWKELCTCAAAFLERTK